MSRLAKQPVLLPEGVSATVNGQDVTVKGKLGELSLAVNDEVCVEMKDGSVIVSPKSSTRFSRNIWGTVHSLLRGMVEGVTKGFKKELQIQGVGYRAAIQGKDLVLQLGFSHEVRYAIPAGIDIKCPSQVEIEVSGMDKQKVGQVAAEIFSFRPPEPYKGKGVRFKGQYVLRKEGKKK